MKKREERRREGGRRRRRITLSRSPSGATCTDHQVEERSEREREREAADLTDDHERDDDHEVVVRK